MQVGNISNSNTKTNFNGKFFKSPDMQKLVEYAKKNNKAVDLENYLDTLDNKCPDYELLYSNNKICRLYWNKGWEKYFCVGSIDVPKSLKGVLSTIQKLAGVEPKGKEANKLFKGSSVAQIEHRLLKEFDTKDF